MESHQSPATPLPPRAVGAPDSGPGLRRLGEGVSRPPWSGRAAVCLVLITLAGIKLTPDFFWFSELLAHVPMLCALVYVTWRAGMSIGLAFGFRGVRLGPTLISGVLLFIIESSLQVIVTLVLLRFGLVEAAGEDIRVQAHAAISSPFAFADVHVLAPFCEELACRGLLYTALRTRLGVPASAMGSACVFAFIHPYSFFDSIPLLLPAFVSALWYERTRSLWPNILSHSLTNTTTTLLHSVG